MRINLALAEEVLAAARRKADAEGRTIDEVVEDCIRESLLRDDRTAVRTATLRGFRGGRADRSTDLDDNAAVLDAMDADGSS